MNIYVWPDGRAELWAQREIWEIVAAGSYEACLAAKRLMEMNDEYGGPCTSRISELE